MNASNYDFCPLLTDQSPMNCACWRPVKRGLKKCSMWYPGSPSSTAAWDHETRSVRWVGPRNHQRQRVEDHWDCGFWSSEASSTQRTLCLAPTSRSPFANFQSVAQSQPSFVGELHGAKDFNLRRRPGYLSISDVHEDQSAEDSPGGPFISTQIWNLPQHIPSSRGLHY